MASTGSVSAWDEALLTAMVQYPVPVITGPDDIQTQVDQICRTVASTKAGYPDLDLIVFPEYSTQGLNTAIWSYDEMLLSIDSPEIDRFRAACQTNRVWGVFSLIEKNDNPVWRRSTPPSSSTPTVKSPCTTANCSPGCPSSLGIPATTECPFAMVLKGPSSP